jgi:outer membrane protein OmpA-like peptidoglycan-associated protein
MNGLGRVGILLPVVLLVASGCATKDWVRELLGKKEAEMDQRVEQRVGRVEGRIGEEAQRVEGMGFRIQKIETSVHEVTGVAQGARDRAEAAFTRAEDVDRRLTRLWSNRHNTRVVDAVDVHFGFDRADLADGAQTTLLGVVKELEANPGLTVELMGYTDPKGPVEYNHMLSLRRVEAVRRFLVEKGVRVTRMHAIGLGPIADGSIPDEKKRRVTVKLTVDQD